MSDEIPDWATVRAIALANAEIPESVNSRGVLLGLGTGRALARYIARHEQPPADPLLTAMRRAAAEVPFLVNDDLLESDGSDVREFVALVHKHLGQPE